MQYYTRPCSMLLDIRSAAAASKQFCLRWGTRVHMKRGFQAKKGLSCCVELLLMGQASAPNMVCAANSPTCDTHAYACCSHQQTCRDPDGECEPGDCKVEAHRDCMSLSGAGLPLCKKSSIYSCNDLLSNCIRGLFEHLQRLRTSRKSAR